MQDQGELNMYVKISKVLELTKNYDQKVAIVTFNSPQLLLKSILYRMGLFSVTRDQMLFNIKGEVSAFELGMYDHLFSNKRPIFLPEMNYFTREICLFKHVDDEYNHDGLSMGIDFSFIRMMNMYLKTGSESIGYLIAINLVSVMAMAESKRVRDTLILRGEQRESGLISEKEYKEKASKGGDLDSIYFNISRALVPNLINSIYDDEYFIKIGHSFRESKSRRGTDIKLIKMYLDKAFPGLLLDNMSLDEVDDRASMWNATATSYLVKSMRAVLFSGFDRDSFGSINENYDVWLDIIDDFYEHGNSSNETVQFFNQLQRDMSGDKKSPLLNIYNPISEAIRERMSEGSMARAIFDSDNEARRQEERSKRRDEAELKKRNGIPEYDQAIRFSEDMQKEFGGRYICSHHIDSEVDFDFLGAVRHSGFIFDGKYKKRNERGIDDFEISGGVAWSINGLYSDNENETVMHEMLYRHGMSTSSNRCLRGLFLAKYVFNKAMMFSTVHYSERIQSGLDGYFFDNSLIINGDKFAMIGTKPQEYMKSHIDNLCMRLMYDLSDPRSNLFNTILARMIQLNMSDEQKEFWFDEHEEALFHS